MELRIKCKRCKSRVFIWNTKKISVDEYDNTARVCRRCGSLEDWIVSYGPFIGMGLAILAIALSFLGLYL
jgi:hypothetical protein